MAISLSNDRVSEHTFTLEEIGECVYNEVKCSGGSSGYKFRITAWFYSIDEEKRNVEAAFNSRLYSDGSYFSQYNVQTKVFADDVQLASKSITSYPSDGESVAGAVSGKITIPYNKDGTLTVIAKATLNCASSVSYVPESAEVEIKVTFPNIEKLFQKSMNIKVGDDHAGGIPFVYLEGEYKKGVAHIFDGNTWKKGA